MQIEQQSHQFCKISVDEFTTKARFVLVKLVGSIKTIFKHQKYIIEVYLHRQLVMRSFKRYNDFQALYQLIKMKYKNEDVGEFPSKFQIFGKEQTRRQFFENFLNTLIKGHQQNRRLVSVIYLFLAKDIQYKPLIQEQAKSNDGRMSNQSNQQNLSTPIKLRAIQPKKLDNIPNSDPKKHKGSLDIGNTIQVLQKKNQVQIKRRNRNSVDRIETIYQNHVQGRKGLSQNEFQVKFQHEKQWRKRFLKIEGSTLLIYKEKLDNNFRTKMELYRIKVEYLKRNMNFFEHFCQKLQINAFNFVRAQDSSILSLYHEYDSKKVLIRKALKQRDCVQHEYAKYELSRLKKQIQVASEYISLRQTYQGVFNPISKLFIIIQHLKLDWKQVNRSETIFIRVKTSSFSYESRQMLYQDKISVKQGFYIPISNTFEDILIHCVIVKEEGWLNESSQQLIVGEYKICMPDLLTEFEKRISMQVEMHCPQKKRQSKTWLQITMDNYSHISSVYSDSYGNEEDGKSQTSVSIDDLTQLSITVDRVLRIVGHIALFIQAFWRNVYLFKYPRMGYCFFAWLLFNMLFVDTDKTIYVIIIGLILIVFYNHSTFQIYADEILAKYIFILHKNFKSPKILGKSQVSFLKWSNHLKYIGQDYSIKSFSWSNQLNRIEKKPDAKRQIFQFTRHGTIFQVREQPQTILQKFRQIKKIVEIIRKFISSIVNIIEKITGLLTWVDPRRTTFILMLLFIISGIANTFLIRGLVTLFCIHRLVKGTQFYRSKHYRNNRRFGIYGMRYIISKNYPHLLKDKQNKEIKQLQVKLKQATQEQVFASIARISLPISDQKQQKKLKSQLQQIIGVYFDVQGQASKLKKQKFHTEKLIEMIQTCESRLKLKWIPGKQGISNQFQELKQITKEVPVIDVWLESLVFNFVLNIPSKLYMTFHEKRSI